MSENIEENNKSLITELNEREKFWNATIKGLASKLTCTANEVVQLQSELLSAKQILIDEIKYITYELYQYKPIVKRYRKLKTEFYLTKYPIKLQGKDKLYLIEDDLAMYEQRLDIYDNHIEFLRETLSNMDNIGYGIKNKIVLYQLTDIE